MQRRSREPVPRFGLNQSGAGAHPTIDAGLICSKLTLHNLHSRAHTAAAHRTHIQRSCRYERALSHSLNLEPFRFSSQGKRQEPAEAQIHGQSGNCHFGGSFTMTACSAGLGSAGLLDGTVQWISCLGAKRPTNRLVRDRDPRLHIALRSRILRAHDPGAISQRSPANLCGLSH
jgi:hypothetical protein